MVLLSSSHFSSVRFRKSQPPPARQARSLRRAGGLSGSVLEIYAMSIRTLTLLLVAAIGSIAGCNSRDGVALFPVEGELKCNGQPLAGAQVVFHPRERTAKVPPARAQTDASGKFKLTTFNT